MESKSFFRYILKYGQGWCLIKSQNKTPTTWTALAHVL